MPISRQARMIRRAISPRLAMRIREDMVEYAGGGRQKADGAREHFCPLPSAYRLLIHAGLTRNSGWSNWTVWPFWQRTRSIVPLTPALWVLNVFIASMMQTSVSSLTLEPTETNGFSPGLGEA